MEHLALFGLLVSHEMQEWHKSLASQLVDQLALPEQHDVLLALYSFFLYISKQQNMTHSLYETVYLLLLTTLAAKISPVFFFSTILTDLGLSRRIRSLTFVDFTEGSTTELLDNSIAFFQDLLTFLEHYFSTILIVPDNFMDLTQI